MDNTRIRYGAHCYLFTEKWSDKELPLLATAKQLTLDCFDIAVGDDVAFDPGLTRQHAEKHGIELNISPGGRWPVECDLGAGKREHCQLGLAWHMKQVDLAAKLGATMYSGALYGHPGVLHGRHLRQDEKHAIAKLLAELAAYGQKRKVRIVLEPMSHFRTHVATTPAQIMELIDLAGHANLFIQLDTYHMVTEVRDYAQAIRDVKDRLCCIHACENDRGVPGNGLVPWNSIFKTLAEINYCGAIVFEAYNSAIPGFAERRGIMQDICPDSRRFVEEGLAFMKQGMATRIRSEF